jgi:hypothetical protein
MTSYREIFSDSELRKPILTCLAAAVAWIAAFALLAVSGGEARDSWRGLDESSQVIGFAMRFHALPRTGAKKAAASSHGDPLGTLERVVDALGLRERRSSLQSNASGVVIQLGKLYGGELRDLLKAVESEGLEVKTAELRAMPGEGGRVMNVTLVVAP